MSNLSILERNIVLGFGAYADAHGAERTFLSSIDRHGLLTAERMANEWGGTSDALVPMLAAASRPFGDADHGVLEFIRVRHLNMRAGAMQ